MIHYCHWGSASRFINRPNLSPRGGAAVYMYLGKVPLGGDDMACPESQEKLPGLSGLEYKPALTLFDLFP